VTYLRNSERKGEPRDAVDRRSRQGQGAVRGPPVQTADRAVHRRRPGPRHGRRVRGAAGAGQAAAGRRRPDRRLQGRAHLQADAEDDRGGHARLRAGAGLDRLRRRRRGAGVRVHPAEDRGRDRLRARLAAGRPRGERAGRAPGHRRDDRRGGDRRLAVRRLADQARRHGSPTWPPTARSRSPAGSCPWTA
jgi:hypothetical protein